MNLFYKLYCRAFQKVFWAAIPLLPYRSPQILSCTAELPKELGKIGVNNLLIVTDKVLHDLGKLEPLKQQLSLENISFYTDDRCADDNECKGCRGKDGLKSCSLSGQGGYFGNVYIGCFYFF